MNPTVIDTTVGLSAGMLRVVRLATTGRPLLVVHGGPDWDHSYLLPAVRPLLDHGVSPILFDLRGCGGSMRFDDSSQYTVSAVVQDMVELMDELGTERVDMLGFSFGGIVAQEFLATHPHRLHRIVLAATAYPVLTAHQDPLPPRPTDALKDRIKWLFKSEPDPQVASRLLAEESLELDVHLPSSLGEARRLIDRISFSGEWMSALRRNTIREPRRFQTSHLVQQDDRVLLLHGENDARFPAAAALAIHQAAPNSVLRIIPNAGHLTYVDAPEPWNHALIDFLSNGPYP